MSNARERPGWWTEGELGGRGSVVGVDYHMHIVYVTSRGIRSWGGREVVRVL